MNTNDTENLVKDLANDSIANVRKLAEMNLGVWDKLAAKQLEMFNLYVETGVKQAELVSSTGDYKEMVEGQATLAKEFGEALNVKGKETIDALNSVRDGYREMVEGAVADLESKWSSVVRPQAD